MLHSLLWCFFQWYDASILAFKLLSLLSSFYPCFYVSFPAKRLQCLLWYFNLGFEASISLIMPIYLLSSFYPCFDPFTHVALLLSELPYFYHCCHASIPAVMTLPLLWYCYHFGHASIHAVKVLPLLSCSIHAVCHASVIDLILKFLLYYEFSPESTYSLQNCDTWKMICFSEFLFNHLKKQWDIGTLWTCQCCRHILCFMPYPPFYLNIGTSLKPWYLRWFVCLALLCLIPYISQRCWNSGNMVMWF